jgi:hypothetical protein
MALTTLAAVIAVLDDHFVAGLPLVFSTMLNYGVAFPVLAVILYERKKGIRI